MSDASTQYADTWKKPPFIKNSVLRWLIYLGTVTYFFVALYTMEVNWPRVAEGIPRGIDMLSKFFPPDLSDSRGVILDGILESIWMAIISTIGGILLSVPIGLGAARNLAPTWMYLFCRSIIAVSRTFPEVILAIFAVKFFGFGPFAGFVALSIGTIGFFAKLLAEDIENMSKSQAEAVRATGASWLQWVNYAIQPQVLPRMIGLSLYRLDINFRESAVVGIVGAGGIGAHLLTSVQRYEYATTATILFSIIGIVIALEYTSGYFRKWVQ
ncbi:MAG: phosphonate ABC transporter, permease protein PhnE [Paracoccaceae bacterium]|nr:phosphonate ABC transporter, permease protein PhnE [Paracoccaceae bacterium]